MRRPGEFQMWGIINNLLVHLSTANLYSDF